MTVRCVRCNDEIPKYPSTNDSRTTSAIIDRYTEKLRACLDLDVAIVGAGPSGLVTARDLALRGLKVALFERKLAPGGSTWGGGMLFNEVVVQEDALPVVRDFELRVEAYGEAGYYTIDSVELASGLIFGALQAGAVVFNAVSVEDVVFQGERVGGVVVNWTPVERTGMHVDPLPGDCLARRERDAWVMPRRPGSATGRHPQWSIPRCRATR